MRFAKSVQSQCSTKTGGCFVEYRYRPACFGAVGNYGETHCLHMYLGSRDCWMRELRMSSTVL